MSTFKIGDRVRLTGREWENLRMGGLEVVIDDVDTDGLPMFTEKNGGPWSIGRGSKFAGSGDWTATLVKSASPPPDTRKRLREYTDLADDDVVVIAGVEFSIAQNGTRIEKPAVMGRFVIEGSAFGDMLVDEVRRKPKMKRRRVYEEVLDDEKHIEGGMLYVKRDDIVISDDKTWVSRSEIAGARLSDTVYRLIEETEVPR